MKCGSKLIEDARYCTSCGAKVIKPFYCPQCGTLTKNRDPPKLTMRLFHSIFRFTDVNIHMQFCEKCRMNYRTDLDGNLQLSWEEGYGGDGDD
jgi:hypothetical protein